MQSHVLLLTSTLHAHPYDVLAYMRTRMSYVVLYLCAHVPCVHAYEFVHAPLFPCVCSQVSGAEDIFALGMLVYELWTSRLLSHGKSDFELMMLTFRGNNYELSMDGLPHMIARMVEACKCPDPDARPSAERVCEMVHAQIRPMVLSPEQAHEATHALKALLGIGGRAQAVACVTTPAMAPLVSGSASVAVAHTHAESKHTPAVCVPDVSTLARMYPEYSALLSKAVCC